MWELSTPFVYMRWFLFTLGKSGSKAYIINGLLMVGTFFVARNVFGTCEPLMHDGVRVMGPSRYDRRGRDIVYGAQCLWRM